MCKRAWGSRKVEGAGVGTANYVHILFYKNRHAKEHMQVNSQSGKK